MPDVRARSLSRAAGTMAGLGAGALAARRWVAPAVRSARMGGSTIAAPDAAAWVTDFLNAAYYARAPDARDVDDLRLAWSILVTRWHRFGHRPLRAWDVASFHAAFGRRRLSTRRTPRGRLDRPDLLAGGAALLGSWLPDGWHDPARRGWGIVFETEGERRAFRPEVRLERAPLGRLTPPSQSAPGTWHTYDAVPLRSIAATAAAIQDPRGWPDHASALGRFTALRSGGLAAQTFEIEVVAEPARRAPLHTRGYVSATRVLAAGDEALAPWIETLEAGLRSQEEPPAVSHGGRPLLGLELTTHAGHFMGAATSNVVIFEDAGGHGFIRDVGRWDRLPWPLEAGYRSLGARAQQAFWGGGAPEDSMLHQFAAA